MKISPHKSMFLCHRMDEEVLGHLSFLLPYQQSPLIEGSRYLGYFLKPSHYVARDWFWLIKKFQHKIGLWSLRWLSLGGRLTLICSVLQSDPVYWFSLFRVPCSVITALRRMMFHFLWAGNISQHKWHLAAWDLLANPTCLGGWGIKDLSLFNSALCAKSLWRVLFDSGLWGSIVKAKYLHRLPPVYWIRSGKSICPGASLVWRSLIKSLPIIQQSLC